MLREYAVYILLFQLAVMGGLMWRIRRERALDLRALAGNEGANDAG